MGKPFDSIELLARIKAHLRRNRLIADSNRDRANNHIKFNGLTIDLDSHYVVAQGQTVSLSLKEFQLLVLLAQNPNKVFTYENLFQSLWDTESLGDYRTIMVHISNIRRKIEQNPKKPEFIKTVKGIGYKFCST